MTKTLLSVPSRTLSRLKALAQRRRTTVSSLMREAVEKAYGIDAGLATERKLEDDPLMKFFGSVGDLIDGGPDDSSINHDKYIYGLQLRKRGARP